MREWTQRPAFCTISTRKKVSERVSRSSVRGREAVGRGKEGEDFKDPDLRYSPQLTRTSYTGSDVFLVLWFFPANFVFSDFWRANHSHRRKRKKSSKTAITLDEQQYLSHEINRQAQKSKHKHTDHKSKRSRLQGGSNDGGVCR